MKRRKTMNNSSTIKALKNITEESSEIFHTNKLQKNFFNIVVSMNFHQKQFRKETLKKLVG